MDPAEQGDEEQKNQAATAEDRNRGHEDQPAKAKEDPEGSRVRSEAARDLVRRVDQLIPLIGDVSLATNIGLLKRDLSRCHDTLKSHPSESEYLSIVTLVESAMTQLKWKQYTRTQLEAIREALEIGYRQVRVTFEHYENARALFSRQRVDSTPRINLDAVKWEDIADDEEA